MDVELQYRFSNISCAYNCTNDSFDITELILGDESPKLPIVKFGEQFYAYVSPVICLVGLLGNSLSLGVFMSKNLRCMSASRYLAALSIVDIVTLIFYVLSEWLKRGLKVIYPERRVTFFDSRGICQLWLYFSYISRFLSAWLIVCFTCERFIGVCLPLRRRSLGSLKETTRVIVGLTIISCIIVVYKPIMSEVRTIRKRTTCTSVEEYIYESFILDSTYALLTFFVPFIIIATLNTLIIRRLLRKSYRSNGHLVTEESHIRLEFTFILLVISFFFMILNLPFFAVWVRNFLYSWMYYTNGHETSYDDYTFDYWVGVLSITRTIFYMNYCINFFLYSVTGAYFRKELRALFTKSYKDSDPCNATPNNTNDTNIRNKNSWV